MNFEEFKKNFQKVPVEIIKSKITVTPLVTVCIQTYNHERYIRDCLNGVLLQKTSFPIEILLAEDDSSDGTREICLEFASNFGDRITLLLHSRKNNIKVGGYPSANFIGLYNFYSARGKYIAICEGDDIWTDPLKLQKQFDFMESNSNYSICYHDYQIIGPSGNIINSKKASPLKFDLSARELLLPFVHPATLTIFFKNDVSKMIPKQITKVLALDVFLYSLLGQTGPGKFLGNIKPALYRVHRGGLWTEMKLEPKLLSKINTFSQLSNYYLSMDDKETAKVLQRRIFKIKKYMIIFKFRSFLLKYLFKPFQKFFS